MKDVIDRVFNILSYLFSRFVAESQTTREITLAPIVFRRRQTLFLLNCRQKTQLIQFQFDVKRLTDTLFRWLTLRRIGAKTNSLLFFLSFSSHVVHNGETTTNESFPLKFAAHGKLPMLTQQWHRKTKSIACPPLKREMTQ